LQPIVVAALLLIGRRLGEVDIVEVAGHLVELALLDVQPSFFSACGSARAAAAC
jgi:hypothetical protein